MLATPPCSCSRAPFSVPAAARHLSAGVSRCYSQHHQPSLGPRVWGFKRSSWDLTTEIYKHWHIFNKYYCLLFRLSNKKLFPVFYFEIFRHHWVKLIYDSPIHWLYILQPSLFMYQRYIALWKNLIYLNYFKYLEGYIYIYKIFELYVY